MIKVSITGFCSVFLFHLCPAFVTNHFCKVKNPQDDICSKQTKNLNPTLKSTGNVDYVSVFLSSRKSHYFQMSSQSRDQTQSHQSAGKSQADRVFVEKGIGQRVKERGHKQFLFLHRYFSRVV